MKLYFYVDLYEYKCTKGLKHTHQIGIYCCLPLGICDLLGQMSGTLHFSYILYFSVFHSFLYCLKFYNINVFLSYPYNYYLFNEELWFIDINLSERNKRTRNLEFNGCVTSRICLSPWGPTPSL